MSPQRKSSGGRSGGRSGRRSEFSRKYTPRRRVCSFCVDKISYIDYKDVPRLRRHLSERGKIEPRRRTGTCAKHQRALAVALKRARHVALLPYTAEHIRLSGMVMRSPDDRRRDAERPARPAAPPAEAATDGVAAEAATEGVAAEATASATEAETAVATGQAETAVATGQPETAVATGEAETALATGEGEATGVAVAAVEQAASAEAESTTPESGAAESRSGKPAKPVAAGD